MARKRPAVGGKTLDAVFNALTHPARRQVLVCLRARNGTMTAGELADRFRHAWATTSHHLSVLEKAGLVSRKKVGRERHYTLTPSPALASINWMLGWADEDGGDGARRSWQDLPYASMRNTRGPNRK